MSLEQQVSPPRHTRVLCPVAKPMQPSCTNRVKAGQLQLATSVNGEEIVISPNYNLNAK